MGLVAGFWHIDWVAGVCFLVAAFVGLGVRSAGFTRLELPPQADGIVAVSFEGQSVT